MGCCARARRVPCLGKPVISFSNFSLFFGSLFIVFVVLPCVFCGSVLFIFSLPFCVVCSSMVSGIWGIVGGFRF